MKKEKITFQEKAYRGIIEKISAGQIKMGDPLREETLAEEFDLSATPVREALRRLEREGWVEMRPYRGCYLKQFTAEDIRELFFMRSCLECELVSAAAQKITPTNLAVIRRALDAERLAVDHLATHPERDIYYEDVEFHLAIIRPAKMQRVEDLLLVLQRQTIGICCCLALEHSLATAEATWQEHRMIYQAMEKRYEGVVRELVRQHITDGCQKLIEALNRQPKDV